MGTFICEKCGTVITFLTGDGDNVKCCGEDMKQLHAVNTEGAGEKVRLTIADEGPGIPPEDLPHVFEQFYRGEKSRNRASGGSGIGLSLAKSFVEAQGGHIEARNRPQGGAEFVVEI